ncbi:MAG: aminodeoxychorismate synthase component I [Candidatus Omnitrophica bacterium]|nr:aminodeoxychorismate synthase component I [Candidatus Omnitrophota bacterium]
MEHKFFTFHGAGRDVLRCFQDEPFAFLLESSLLDKSRGRYSFVGFDPFFVFESKGSDTLTHLREQFLCYRSRLPEKGKGPVPFSCGIVGVLGYEFGLPLENVRGQSKEDLLVPDCCFGFYDSVVVVDHLKHRLHVCSSGLPEKNYARQEKRAASRLKKILKKLEPLSVKESYACRGPSLGNQINLQSNFTKKEYLQAVRKALSYIRQGEIYQVNLSQRFCFDAASFEGSVHPVDVYDALTQISPSCFGGYFDGGDFQVISSSPERFLRVRGRKVETRPMKGTRPRGATLREDSLRKQELTGSPKDMAELLMITDLERNDLGRVCQYGSINVRQMRTIEEYSTVFQATSSIEGRLRKGKDCFDVLRASFPGGSITGCPKIRAMQIIDELEPSPRSVYTGALGYISFRENMDFNILIRTLLFHQGKAYFHVGGGIVADSTPEGEYQETLVKAKAMKECLQRIFV